MDINSDIQGTFRTAANSITQLYRYAQMSKSVHALGSRKAFETVLAYVDQCEGDKLLKKDELIAFLRAQIAELEASPLPSSQNKNLGISSETNQSSSTRALPALDPQDRAAATCSEYDRCSARPTSADSSSSWSVAPPGARAPSADSTTHLPLVHSPSPSASPHSDAFSTSCQLGSKKRLHESLLQDFSRVSLFAGAAVGEAGADSPIDLDGPMLKRNRIGSDTLDYIESELDHIR
eukprot:Rmarinus@m.5648